MSELPNKTKLKFDLDSLIGLKNSKIKDSMNLVHCAIVPSVHYALGNVHFIDIGIPSDFIKTSGALCELD